MADKTLVLNGISYSRAGKHLIVSDLSLSLVPTDCIQLNLPNEDSVRIITKIISRELDPSSGSGLLLGYPLKKTSKARRRKLLRRIGIVRQYEPFPRELTLFEYIALPLRISGMAESRVMQTTKHSLGEFELTLRLRQKLANLSPQDQRLAQLIQATVKSPDLIVLETDLDRFDVDMIIPQLQRCCSFGSSALILAYQSTPEPVGAKQTVSEVITR